MKSYSQSSWIQCTQRTQVKLSAEQETGSKRKPEESAVSPQDTNILREARDGKQEEARGIGCFPARHKHLARSKRRRQTFVGK